MQPLPNRLNFDKNKLILRLIIGYLCLSGATMAIISLFFNPELLLADHFIHWDGEHYFYIKNYGYEGYRVAFFPLFPLVWAGLNLSVYGIIGLNIILFLSSVYFLTRRFKQLNFYEIGLYLTIPSLFFCGVAYTEAFFFACTTLIIISLQKNNLFWLCVGLFLAGLCRPAFIFFAPALVAAEIYADKISFTKAYFIDKIAKISLYAFVLILALISVFSVHYLHTGNFWAYFEASKQWGGVLMLPTFPLKTWGTGAILKLDAVALLIGLAAFIFTVYKVIKHKIINHIQLPKEVIFSLVYLGGIGLFLFFRGGTLFSINRFMLCNPFLIVVINYFIHHPFSIKAKHLIYTFILLNVYFLLFGTYTHIKTLISFILLAAYLLLFISLKYNFKPEKYKHYLAYSLIAANFSLQMYFLYLFLIKEWVG